MQMRSGHVPLNAYLYRITKWDSPTCTHCKAGDKMTHHYLFDCVAWIHKWWLLGQSLGWASKSLQSLLGSKWGVSKVLKFIGRTKRFKNIEQ